MRSACRVAAVGLWVGVIPAAGVESVPDPLDVAKSIMSPVCPGRLIADCPSPEAEQLREVIRRQIKQGKSKGEIIDYFVDEYRDGRTPNPCARCNQWIKFDVFHDLARDLGAEFVATGHYARVLQADDGPRLARGLDIDGIKYVVNFEVPPNRDTYIHRVGRTARLDATGSALTLAAPDELPAVRALQASIDLKLREHS